MQNKYIPTSAIVAVTYRCNSRCRMCGIWKKKDHYDLPLEFYKKLPSTLEEINITGGEPFLRQDFVDILDVIYATCKPKKISIPTNGFLTEKIVSDVKEIMKKDYVDIIDIAISLDGTGKIHEEVRGIPDAYNKVMKTVEELKKIGFPAEKIGFGFTYMKGNEKEGLKIYELAKKLHLNYGISLAYNSDNFYGTDANEQLDMKITENQIDTLVKEEIGSFAKNKLGKVYFLSKLVEHAKTGRRPFACGALRDSFFIDPNGDVFSCLVLNEKIGNLKLNTFNEIWNSERANKVRSQVANCQKCWMLCDSKMAIKRHWLQVGFWVIKNKIKYGIKKIKNSSDK